MNSLKPLATAQTVQIAFSQVALPPGKDAWTFACRSRRA